MFHSEYQAILASIEDRLNILKVVTQLEPDPVGIPVIPVEGDLQAAINAASNDGVILDLLGREHVTSTIKIPKTITLRNGSTRALPNTNDMFAITGDGVKFEQFKITGDGTTKNGISANGDTLTLEDTDVLNIGRPGIESHALVTWDGKNITVRGGSLQGGSMAFLSGGTTSSIPNHVPSNILFENVKMIRPLEWKGKYGSKTIMEFKNARNVVVRNCILENNWHEGPQGHAITITPSNHNNPETIVENVLYENCKIIGVNGGVSALGYSQHADKPTLRGNNYRFVSCEWSIRKSVYGGQGALVTFAQEPLDVQFINNLIDSDGDGLIRCNDSKIIENFKFINNPRVVTPGTYGIVSPLGHRGASWATQFKGGEMTGNTFTGAHSTFRANFPLNTYVA